MQGVGAVEGQGLAPLVQAPVTARGQGLGEGCHLVWLQLLLSCQQPATCAAMQASAFESNAALLGLQCLHEAAQPAALATGSPSFNACSAAQCSTYHARVAGLTLLMSAATSVPPLHAPMTCATPARSSSRPAPLPWRTATQSTHTRAWSPALARCASTVSISSLTLAPQVWLT